MPTISVPVLGSAAAASSSLLESDVAPRSLTCLESESLFTIQVNPHEPERMISKWCYNRLVEEAGLPKATEEATEEVRNQRKRKKALILAIDELIQSELVYFRAMKELVEIISKLDLHDKKYDVLRGFIKNVTAIHSTYKSWIVPQDDDSSERAVALLLEWFRSDDYRIYIQCTANCIAIYGDVNQLVDRLDRKMQAAKVSILSGRKNSRQGFLGIASLLITVIQRSREICPVLLAMLKNRFHLSPFVLDLAAFFTIRTVLV